MSFMVFFFVLHIMQYYALLYHLMGLVYMQQFQNIYVVTLPDERPWQPEMLLFLASREKNMRPKPGGCCMLLPGGFSTGFHVFPGKVPPPPGTRRVQVACSLQTVSNTLYKHAKTIVNPMLLGLTQQKNTLQ